MTISKRLKTIADLVTEGFVTADIGTDHGYVPIYLLLNSKIPKALCCDLSEGALRKAEENAEKFKLVLPVSEKYFVDTSEKKEKKTPIFAYSEKIEFRLGNGLSVLEPNEAETVIISGMGGILIVKILEENIDVTLSAKELILSPHRDAELVRSFLQNNKFLIVFDDVIVDKKKKYTIIKAIRQ